MECCTFNTVHTFDLCIMCNICDAERCITASRDSLLPKISSTWSCQTVRTLRWSPHSNSANVVTHWLHNRPPAVVVYSSSATVQAVGECVWTHYLAVTQKEESGGVLSLSAVQQQEVWLQFSALQIALQVSSRLHTFTSEHKAFWSTQVFISPQAYNLSLKSHPSDTSISGLSYIHLFLRAFSQVLAIYYNLSFKIQSKAATSEAWQCLKSRRIHLFVSCRWTVTQTCTVTSCRWSHPSWPQSCVANPACVQQIFTAQIQPSNAHHTHAEHLPGDRPKMLTDCKELTLNGMSRVCWHFCITCMCVYRLHPLVCYSVCK